MRRQTDIGLTNEEPDWPPGSLLVRTSGLRGGGVTWRAGLGGGGRRQNTQSLVTRVTCHTGESGDPTLLWWRDNTSHTCRSCSQGAWLSVEMWGCEGQEQLLVCDKENATSELGSWRSPTRGTWRVPPPGASPGSSSSGREAHCHQTFNNRKLISKNN